MRKFSLIVILLSSHYGYTSSLISFLWGKKPDNSIQIGSAVNHFIYNTDYPTILFKPYTGLTYHSLTLVYFQSCSNDNGGGIGIQRNLYSYTHNNNHLSLGYKLGITYGGWCINRNGVSTAGHTDCQDHMPILPVAQMFLDYSYKNVGLELTEIRDVLTLSFLYRFKEH